MGEDTTDIYDPAFVADLFDRCAARYRWWSVVASFGFVWLWRRICVRRLASMMRISRVKGGHIVPLPQVFDLMAGTGEVWPHLFRDFSKARITAIDISDQMHAQAVARLHAQNAHRISCLQADALTAALPQEEADLVISTFGLKTLTPAGQARLAAQIASALRPGGAFALIEASDPRGWTLRPLYRLYMDRILPMIERTVLRGAQDFAMIGVYTRAFGDCTHFADCLRQEGLFVSQRAHTFGCASSVAGFKPMPAAVAPEQQTQ